MAKKFKRRISAGLRRFAVFLKQCVTAMNSVKGLSVLIDDRENRKMLLIIPEWLVSRWSTFVAQWKEKHKEFPPFKEFAQFLEKEAKVACDPVTLLHLLKQDHGQRITDKTVSVSHFKSNTPYGNGAKGTW